jgi:hypothetical protein
MFDILMIFLRDDKLEISFLYFGTINSLYNNTKNQER